MRLFFALWPDEPAAAALATIGAELAARSEGKAVPVEKVHLTLAFLGETDADGLESARAAAAGLGARALDVVLDTVGSFRGARVAWVGCHEPGAALAQLQSRLAARLGERGFTLDDRPYTPHLTVARKIRRSIPPAQIEAIRWRAREVSLVRSETGTGRYTTLERWALASDESP
jgi:2'-5' RNA ligase